MILRSLVWFLFFFTVYALLAPLAERRLLPKATAYFDAEADFHQSNHLRGQSLLYEDLKGVDIYVGSSLSTRLASALLSPPFAKHEYIGGTPLTLLKVLAEGGKKPRRVFIEANYLISRAVDQRLLDLLFSPPLGDLRKRFPFLRRFNKPSNLILLSFYARDLQPFKSNAATERARLERLQQAIEVDDLPINEPHRKQAIAQLLPEYRGSVPGFEPWLKVAAQCIETLEARGVPCVFYRMPYDPVCEEDPSYQLMQKMLVDRFPASRFPWILPEPSYDYHTEDGFHLTWKSGVAYSRHFVAAKEALEGGGHRGTEP